MRRGDSGFDNSLLATQRDPMQPIIFCYLFAYFIGNGEDGLHLAWSRDGYKYEALNGGRSYLQPTVGESKLMRDPCVVQAPDGTFHMVWTTAWNGKTIGYASSKNLTNWSEQRAIPVMASEPGVKNCWAPEVAYDDQKKDYVIFWASTVEGKFTNTMGLAEQYNHRIYATTTKDFQTFTPTKLFFDPGFIVIDATFLKTTDGLRLIFKDETLKPVAKKNLLLASAAGYEGPFTDVTPPFTKDKQWVEGPTALRIGEDYVVFYDCYREGHYGAMRSKDLKTWEDVSTQIAIPRGARHGTIIRVPESVIAPLRDAK
jgi:hypothetical protein